MRWESIAAGILQIAKEDGKKNIADILTKLLKGPTLRELSELNVCGDNKLAQYGINLG